QLRTIGLPARTLKVLPGVPATISVPAAKPVEPTAQIAPSLPAKGLSWPWHWISLTLVILWLGTLLAWWLSRRKLPLPLRERSTKSGEGPGERESQSRERFLSACKLNDAMAARQALLAWSQAKGLRALAHRIADPNVEALLLELDRACFAG